MHFEHHHLTSPASTKMIFSIALLLFTQFLVMVVLVYKSFYPSNPGGLPPSPPGLPIIGNFHQIGSLPHRSLRNLSSKYGHIMLLRLGSVPTVVVSSAEAAELVLKTHDVILASRPPSVMGNILMYGCRDIGMSPYGEYWRQVKKIGVLHLLSTKQVELSRHIIVAEVSLMVHKIRSVAEERVDITKMLKVLVKDIVCKVVLGRKYFGEEEGSKKYEMLVAEFIHLLGYFPVGDYIPWLAWVDNVSGLLKRARKNARELDMFIEKVLEDHHRNKETHHADAKDFVDILLTLDKEASGGISLSRHTIKAIILDMFSAGTHSTSTTMDWFMVELMRHPDILKKVQQEVRKKVGNKTCITEGDVSGMVYFKAAIKETLRLHPPGALLIPRESRERIKLCGYDVPAKTRVLVNAWAIGRDPRFWGDLADEFMPDRFLNSTLDLNLMGVNFQYIPFGAGRRSCPGINFSVATMEYTLACLLYNFDWDMPDGLKREEMDMTEVAGIAVGRKSKLLLRATPHLF